ncbi:threonylcarbamoyl-AMP synthase [Candidatus Uhrbacteria bacterium]|nr:threonylcarbamoyl-AMP synthase [Candidatus Uhrbacteria bacterium]
MEIVSLNKETYTRVLRQALRVLRAGGVIVYPTETAYGLGCDATNVAAVKRIFTIKGRSFKKPLPLIVGKRAMADRYVALSPALRLLARTYWPGALTVVAPMNTRNEIRKLSNWETVVSAKTGTVGIRVSAYPFARKLSEKLGKPIVATSANYADGGECYTLIDVLKQLQSNVLPNLCIDGGHLRRRKPSTIITVRDGHIVTLRQGAIAVRKLRY